MYNISIAYFCKKCKKFTVDFLTKKQKVNEGEVPQYFVEHSHPPIIDPEEFEMVQAEMIRRKEIGRTYSSSNIFSSRIICSCCGSFYGSKVWHSNSKYRRVIWQCNHKFKNGERCKTPHFYEDDIKKKFVTACKSVLENREDFIAACKQVRDILSDCTAFEKQVTELYTQHDDITKTMQEYIRRNATKPQKQDEYNEQYEKYEQKSYEIKKDISAVQAKIARRLSRKELLDAMMRELETADLTLPQFDEKLWRIMVENVTAGLDGEMLFKFRNGIEVTVK